MAAGLLEYPRVDSMLHRIDPRWKLAAVALVIVAVALLQKPATAGIAFLGALFLLALSRLPLHWLLVRLSETAIFLILFLILLPLTMDGEEVALGPVSLSRPGLHLAVLICLKAMTVVALALFLVGTAPFDTTLKAAHRLRVPGLLVQLLLLTYRYISLFGDELHRIRIALRVRGYRNRFRLRSFRIVGSVVGTLLVRSYERAERVGQAMRCRGFDGELRTLTAFRTRPVDVIWFVVLVGCAGGLWVCDWA